MRTLDSSTVPEVKILDAEQIKRIDAALAAVGDFGEVRLIKTKGKLRFIQKVKSEKLEESADSSN